jgi:hypothetical protein
MTDQLTDRDAEALYERPHGASVKVNQDAILLDSWNGEGATLLDGAEAQQSRVWTPSRGPGDAS